MTDSSRIRESDGKQVREPESEQVDEAINWLIRFESNDISAQEQQAFQHWLQQSDQHQLAWNRVATSRHHFQAVSEAAELTSGQALANLDQADQAVKQQRKRLKILGSTGILVAGLWITRQQTGLLSGGVQLGRYLYGEMLADLTTHVGEQKTLTLQGGSQLLLNTQTAVNLGSSDQDISLITLQYGEVSLTSSKAFRIFAGQFTFSGTSESELTLRYENDRCRLHVIDGQVDCQLQDRLLTLVTGDAIELTSRGERVRRYIPESHALDWRSGMITAQQMRLTDFVRELARYRPGYLACDEEIADLTLSGSFLIADTDAVLNNLSKILPVKQQRLSAYWVRLMPA